MMGRTIIPDPEPRFVSQTLTQCEDNPRLADAGFAGQHYDLALAAFGHLPAIEEESEFMVAAGLVAQAAARRMIGNKVKGSIVNIASILGVRVAGAVAPYAISKAGVIQMTKALALEWARYGIRVNALAPGYFATELNDDFFEIEHGQALIKRVPQRRLGQLSELDGPLLLLISSAGSFMTGSVVAVDGGHLVSGL
jgi:NAD(P)-dependent dehydrogenase (short-subunit alcohol dehydrogenase family)